MKVFDRCDGVLVVLEPGEKIMESLKRVVEEKDIRSGFLHGIGAGKDFTLGYYDLEKRDYVKKEFPEEYEITSLMGNVGVLDEKPILHIHITLSDNQFRAFGGHLFEGTITGTLEVFIFRDSGKIVRKMYPERNLALIDGVED